MTGTIIFAAFLLFAIIFNLCPVAFAQDLAPVTYINYRHKGSKPTEAEFAEATKQAKQALIEVYFLSLPEARRAALAAKKTTMLSSPDEYLSHYLVRDQSIDKKSKTLTLTVGADIDEVKISRLIDLSGSNNTVSTQAQSQKILFIFFARRQVEVESKGTKVTSGNSDTESNTREVGAIDDGGASRTSIATTKAKVTETVTSTTRTADVITYAIDDNFKADIDGSISGVFVNRGLKVVSPTALLDADSSCDPDDLQKDFDRRSQFTLKHQNLVTKTCRAANIPILAYGALTMLVKRVDAVSGNTLVTVKVDAQIFDCRESPSSKIGSVAGLLVEGVGADQSEAEGQAIKIASEKAANALVDQLSLTGIH
jgi:hypothetical protein